MNYTVRQLNAIKNLLLRMADDELIIGHRNSEWTGIGPILEEDIAFSSMAQDKLGHSLALYQILNKLGEPDPDSLAFTRKENEYLCCHLVEYLIGDYDFSLVRHFLFDTSEQIRFDMLAGSSFEDLANVAKKIRGELRYHTMHADTWMIQLGTSNEVANIRLQNSLNECIPLALGIFELTDFEEEIIENKIFEGEKVLQERWLEKIDRVIVQSNLKMPDINAIQPSLGGRKGFHTEYLKPLLNEMTEVYSIDPEAEW